MEGGPPKSPCLKERIRVLEQRMEKLEDQLKLDGDLHEGMLGHLDFEVTNLYQRVTDLEGGEPSFSLSDE